MLYKYILRLLIHLYLFIYSFIYLFIFIVLSSKEPWEYKGLPIHAKSVPENECLEAVILLKITDL